MNACILHFESKDVSLRLPTVPPMGSIVEYLVAVDYGELEELYSMLVGAITVAIKGTEVVYHIYEN
jgi:hypothetical protein